MCLNLGICVNFEAKWWKFTTIYCCIDLEDVLPKFYLYFAKDFAQNIQKGNGHYNVAIPSI